ncbi:BamA/OMP85 family outer membrane protein [Corallococcus aberystwythensis]|uniref:Polymerase n=1 Tax=Corallococcus aberystwythensis TaxID=2316722 RepID=A0A3A8PFK5_9BACT|nr:BamA/TamA family outer membrane protein [Corallococcus aberystwythensis]RKH55138.1 polymerase [Corallococcus aberystwythensis]
MADVRLLRFRSAVPLALTVLLTACATTSNQPTGPKVKSLDIEGAKKVDDGDIKDRILTSSTPWYAFWPFGKAHYFDTNAWQADLRRIERFYQAEGFYQAQVESNEVIPDGDKAVRLKVVVNEGEPTLIDRIEPHGLEALSEGPDQPSQRERERILEELPVKPGDVFREDTWVTTKDLVLQRLKDLGYAEAEVGGEVRVDVATQKAVVDLQIAPGLRYRFGNIFIATDANPQVPPRRIIEQAQGAVHKGAFFSEAALAEAQARVFRMGVFGAVKVNRGAPDRQNATVPVVVDVRESPFRSIRLGGGIGVDAARQEGRVLGEWTNRNFRGGLRRLTLRGRVGYAFIPNVLAGIRGDEGSQDGPIFNFTTEFEQPRFLFRDVALQASVTAEKGLQQAYSFYGGYLKTGVIWTPHPSFSVFPSYNLQLYRLTGQVSLEEGVPPITLGCENATDATCDQALSFLEVAFAWDRRDDRTEPRDGYYVGFSVQKGGGPFFGQYDYVRLLPDLRYYHSIGEKKDLTLAVKVRAGTLNPAGGGQSSIVTRFFSGGATSMRGFNGQRLSPMTPLAPTYKEDDDGNTLVDEDGNPILESWDTVPVGGNSLVETSVEMRYMLTDALMVAIFYDSGLVGTEALFGKNAARLFGPEHYHAVGAGLRYLTVVGPIRLDIARRLNIGRGLPVSDPGYIYPSSGGCLGFGRKFDKASTSADAAFAGAPEGLCAVHISIGEAF